MLKHRRTAPCLNVANYASQRTAGLKITQEIPEIAGKNTCIPAMSVYMPASLGRCDRNFSKVATARGFSRGLLALAKCSVRCDRNP